MIKRYRYLLNVKITVHVFIVFLMSLFLFNCSSNNSINRIDEEQYLSDSIDFVQTVKTYRIKEQDFYLQALSNGKIISGRSVKLNFNIPGKLIKLNFYNGQFIKKGDTVGILENTEYIINIQDAKVDLERATNEYNELKLKFGNYKDFNNSIRNDSSKTNNYLLSKSGLNKAKVTWEKAYFNYKKTFLISPINGTVANLFVREYDFVDARQNICSIIDRNQWIVDFSIMESEIPLVRNGYSFIKIRPFIDGEELFVGKLLFINPIVEDKGLLRARAKLIGSSPILFEGMNVEVFIEKKISNIICIPKSAVLERQKNKVVFIYVNGRAKWQQVSVKYENSTEYAIESGLKIGDEVIVEGNINLGHDARVTKF